MTSNCRTCVVICYWTGRSTKPLFKLLSAMQNIPAGAPFDVVIVCNGGDVEPLTIPPRFSSMSIRVINRENAGWNLGAWEAGWRASPGYEYFLFLQAECFLKSKDWLHRFEHRMDFDAGMGLLGERIMWSGMTWDYAKAKTALDLSDRPEILSNFESYQQNLSQKGIEPGALGTHVVSIILFTRRSILEDVDGFPLMGDTYVEAVSCEIGLSKNIESRGYRISQLGDDAFYTIGHTQWTALDQIKTSAFDYGRRMYRSVFPRA